MEDISKQHIFVPEAWCYVSSYIGLQQKRSEMEEIKTYSFKRKGLLGSLVFLIEAGRVVVIIKEVSINKEKPLHWNKGKDTLKAPM